MGNHFRTSGDEQSASQAPMPQANGVESKDSVPDFQSDPLAQHAASAGDASAAQPRGKPHAHSLRRAPAQPRINVPDPSVDPVGPSTPSLAGIPDPSAPAAAPAAAAAAPDVFMTSAAPPAPPRTRTRPVRSATWTQRFRILTSPRCSPRRTWIVPKSARRWRVRRASSPSS